MHSNTATHNDVTTTLDHYGIHGTCIRTCTCILHVHVDAGQRHSADYCWHMLMVTLMPRLPLSAKSCAMFVSNTRQSDVLIAAWTPSCMLRGVASHVRRRLWPFSSSLKHTQRNRLWPFSSSLKHTQRHRPTNRWVYSTTTQWHVHNKTRIPWLTRIGLTTQTYIIIAHALWLSETLITWYQLYALRKTWNFSINFHIES